MVITDTDALEERIARELFYTESPEERHRDGWLSAYSEDRYLYRDLAAAVLPIVADEVRKGKAGAWQEGVNFALPSKETYWISKHNPHRATETGDQR